MRNILWKADSKFLVLYCKLTLARMTFLPFTICPRRARFDSQFVI